MTKRVRVLKEMPFAKVGEEFDVEGIDYLQADKEFMSVEFLIFGKWLEWVEEEKSLEEELTGSFLTHEQVPEVTKEGEYDIHGPGKYKVNWKEVAQIATDHFKKKFNEAHEKYWGKGGTLKPYKDYICKTMFGENV